LRLEKRGYAGKILYVNLSEERFHTEETAASVVELLLGGKGLAAFLLFKNLSVGVNPLSPDNVLIIATGPLTGTLAPGSGRFCVTTKSPATGTISDSYCGGFFGSELKLAGYDAVVIRGKADDPSILVINNDDIYLKPAGKIWGLTTYKAEEAVKKVLGEDFKVVVIGPAGERMAPIASIFSGTRSAGRGGIGAVMGSKRLKAIAVKGDGNVEVYDPEEFKKSVWVAHRALRMSEVTVRSLPTYGTPNILETVNETGALPTRNFQTGRFEYAPEISGESFREAVWWRDHSCSLSCSIRCSKLAKSSLPVGGESFLDGPDYETIFSLGSNCGVKDKSAIVKANLICDLYGIDTISTGVIISFVMELYEKGFVSSKDLDGIEAVWGSPTAMIALTEKIAKGEGVGGFLQLGVKRISERYPGSERFAMHVKGLEIPGYDPRAAQGMGLCYAISERGACHLKAFTAGRELLGYQGGTDPKLYDETKVKLAIDLQNEKAVADSAIICFFTLLGMRLKEVYQMLKACTGFDYGGLNGLMELGARVVLLSRLFNVREGFRRRDDNLPRRLLEEPLPEGPAKGMVVHLKPMLESYYRMRGLTEEGVPTVETLRHYKIDSVIDIDGTWLNP